MNNYAIYCTEEQTKKALELGAPIEVSHRIESVVNRKYFSDLINFTFTIIPTSEQMIGWLEEQDKICSIEITLYEGYWQYIVRIFNHDEDVWNDEYDACLTRQEATLAAIDAALEYLSNQKKKNK